MTLDEDLFEGVFYSSPPAPNEDVRDNFLSTLAPISAKVVRAVLSAVLEAEHPDNVGAVYFDGTGITGDNKGRYMMFWEKRALAPVSPV
jgi:hypothetical protein